MQHIKLTRIELICMIENKNKHIKNKKKIRIRVYKKEEETQLKDQFKIDERKENQ